MRGLAIGRRGCAKASGCEHYASMSFESWLISPVQDTSGYRSRTKPPGRGRLRLSQHRFRSPVPAERQCTPTCPPTSSWQVHQIKICTSLLSRLLTQLTIICFKFLLPPAGYRWRFPSMSIVRRRLCLMKGNALRSSNHRDGTWMKGRRLNEYPTATSRAFDSPQGRTDIPRLVHNRYAFLE